jgi:phosphatidylglycerol:prolipoprotein diacylglycerol transferase
MHPELITFFGFTPKAYSFFTYLAGLVVFSGTFWLAGKSGLAKSKTVIVLMAMVIGTFIGARLLHILLNYGLYKSSPELVFSLDFRNFSLYGGILLAAFLGFITCRVLKLNLWLLSDSAAPFLGIGIALMRLGCFLNGCCFGKITSLPWGVHFPALSQAHIYQLAHGKGGLLSASPVHPTQLYELLSALAASGLALYLVRKKYPPGSAMLAFIIFFTAWRWISYSYFRVMPDTFDAPPYFYPLLYAGIILVSLVMLKKKIRT